MRRRFALCLLMIAPMACSHATPPSSDDTAPLQRRAVSSNAICVALAPDGSHIAVGEVNHHIEIIDRDHANVPAWETTSHGYSIDQLKISDDGKTLFCLSGTGLLNSHRRIEAWHLPDKTELIAARQNSPRTTLRNTDAWTADMSFDGTTIVCGGGNLPGLWRLNLASGEFVSANSHLENYYVNWAAYSPSGKTLAVIATNDPNLNVWTVFILRSSDFSIQESFDEKEKAFVAFAGERLVAAVDEPLTDHACIIDIRTRRKLISLQDSSLTAIQSVAASPDGKVIGVQTDHLRLWNLLTGSLILDQRADTDGSHGNFCLSNANVAQCHAKPWIGITMFASPQRK